METRFAADQQCIVEAQRDALIINFQVKDINNLLENGKIQQALRYYGLATNEVKEQIREKLTEACNKKINTLLLVPEGAMEAQQLFEYAKGTGIEVFNENLIRKNAINRILKGKDSRNPQNNQVNNQLNERAEFSGKNNEINRNALTTFGITAAATQIKEINDLLTQQEITKALESYVQATNEVKGQTKQKLTGACNEAINTLSLLGKDTTKANQLLESAKRAGIIDTDTFQNKAIDFLDSNLKQKSNFTVISGQSSPNTNPQIKEINDLLKEANHSIPQTQSIVETQRDARIFNQAKEINDLPTREKITKALECYEYIAQALEYYKSATNEVKDQTKQELTLVCQKTIDALLATNKEAMSAFDLFESAREKGLDIEVDSIILSAQLNRLAFSRIISKEHFSNGASLFERMYESPKIKVWQEMEVAYAIAYLDAKNQPRNNAQRRSEMVNSSRELITKLFIEKAPQENIKFELNPFALAVILSSFRKTPHSMVKLVNCSPYVKKDAVRSLTGGNYAMGVIQKDIFNKTVTFNKENSDNETHNKEAILKKEKSANKKLEKYKDNITSRFTIQALIYDALTTKKDLSQLTVHTKIDNINEKNLQELKELKDHTTRFLRDHCKNFEVEEIENSLVIKRRNNDSSHNYST